MDWSLFHALNGALRHQDGGQDAAVAFNAGGIFGLVALAGALWLIARPGGLMRPKLAAVAAGMAALVALIGNSVLGRLWFHDRPFMDHPHTTLLLVHHAADNSFPSDHASVAFAIAFAVASFYRRYGVVLLLGAGAVGIDRVFVGVHYPLDVATSVAIGFVSAFVVTRFGRSLVERVATLLSRVSDPILRGVWQLGGQRP